MPKMANSDLRTTFKEKTAFRDRKKKKNGLLMIKYIGLYKKKK